MAEYPHRIGRIIRAHGLRGDVLVQLFRPRPVDPAQFEYTKERPTKSIELVFEDGREIVYDVQGVRFVNPASFVAALATVDSREAADGLVGAFVDIDPDDPPSVADEVDRVFGAMVVNAETGAELGAVDDIRDNGAQAVLVVGDDEILIPWVDAFIEDVSEGPPLTVHVRPIPGLLEANER